MFYRQIDVFCLIFKLEINILDNEEICLGFNEKLAKT